MGSCCALEVAANVNSRSNRWQAWWMRVLQMSKSLARIIVQWPQEYAYTETDAAQVHDCTPSNRQALHPAVSQQATQAALRRDAVSLSIALLILRGVGHRLNQYIFESC